MKIKSFANLEGKDFDRFLAAFCALPGQVKVGNGAGSFVPPSAVWISYICQPAPSANLLTKEFWIAEDGLGRPIGRVGANVMASHAHRGAIGFFEVDLKHPEGAAAAHELLKAAERWLADQGVTKVYGPMNFSPWYAYRFRIDHENVAAQAAPEFAWEPANPPEYCELWKKSGYTENRIFTSRAFDNLAGFTEANRRFFDRALKRGYSFKPFDPVRLLNEQIELLFDVSMQSLKNSPLFEPLDFAAFRALYVSMSGKADLALAHAAVDPTGAPAAFLICFEEQEHLIFRRQAVADAHRGQNLLQALKYLAGERGMLKGLNRYVTALEPGQKKYEDEISTLLWEHVYALFAKRLGN